MAREAAGQAEQAITAAVCRWLVDGRLS